ncbi:MAG: ParA family protein [Clostridia bacterium]|nr:ParA family protein [Clostridia bacterium]
MTKVVAFANQKGGVGKTTTCVNLATYLAAYGKKVLLVDLDPQGNATTGVGVQKTKDMNTFYDVVAGEAELVDIIMATNIHNLFIVPSNVDLAGAEVDLVQMENREKVLAKQLDTVKASYDYVMIDCPPSLGLITVNALTSTDSVIIPIQCEFYALEGLSQLMNTVKLIKQYYNPNIDIEGVILTMKDSRSNLVNQVADEIKSFFGKKVFETVIPRNVRLAEAPSHGLPIYLYDNKSTGGIAYNDLAREFLKRNKDSGALIDRRKFFKGDLTNE